MKFLKDDSGVAYGLVMMFVTLAIGIFAWMFVGILIDHLEGIFNSMRDMFSDTIGDRVTDLVNIYSYLPFFIVAVAALYLMVRGLRREESV